MSSIPMTPLIKNRPLDLHALEQKSEEFLKISETDAETIIRTLPLSCGDHFIHTLQDPKNSISLLCLTFKVNEVVHH